MAGFEVVVRPVVFPNIRPSPAHGVPGESDPKSGVAVITGGGGSMVGMSRTWSISLSRQLPHKESKRQFDKERVHQVDENKKINKKNYVEVERMKRVRLETDLGPIRVLYADPPALDNVDVLETDVTRGTKSNEPA